MAVTNTPDDGGQIDPSGARILDLQQELRQVEASLTPILTKIETAFNKIGEKLKEDIKSAFDGVLDGGTGGTGGATSSAGTNYATKVVNTSKHVKTVHAGTEAAEGQVVKAGAEAAAGGGGGMGFMKNLIKGGGGAFAKTAMAGTVIGATTAAVNMGINAANARFDRGREGVLAADRMSVLYQQMTGLGQLDVSSKYRMPLTNYRLGAGGINDIMNMEAQIGIRGIPQASSIEAMRTLSGYSLSTGDVTGMIGSLTSAPTANRMFMMTGMGMIGPGGQQNSMMSVMKNLVSVAGLTSEQAIKDALLPGSITRARLANMGVPPEMITQVIQYAQSNVSYQKKGGKGMYDPSRKADRRLMGIEENFATQVEETQRLETKRDEQFYRRQVDNFAYLERQTQSLTRAFGFLEDKLSGILGFTASNRIATQVFQGITAGGDPSGVGGGAKGYVRGVLSSGGDPDNVTAAKNNSSFQALHPKMQDRVINLLSDNPKVRFGKGLRTADEQRKMFMERYTKTSSQYNSRGEKNVEWNGSYWEHTSGLAAAPPGRSMHEIGLAVDFEGDTAWVAANSEKYGLKNFANVNNEPHHVQPIELPNSRNQYEKGGAGWGTGPAGAAPFSYDSDFGDLLDHSAGTPMSSAVADVSLSPNGPFQSISQKVSKPLDNMAVGISSGSASGVRRGGYRRGGSGSSSTSPTGTPIINSDALSAFKHGGMAKSGVDIGKWSAEFLALVGAPVTLANLEAMSAWIAAEGTRAAFNPLAVVSTPTAEAMGGTGNLEGWSDFNPPYRVKNFANYEQGLKMNAYHVMKHGKGVVNVLKTGTSDPYKIITAIEQMVADWTTKRGITYAARSVLEGRDVPTNVVTPTTGTSAQGDPAPLTMMGSSRGSSGVNSMSVVGGHTFNISPNITMSGTGSPRDLQKMAKELAAMIRREIELDMLRSI